MKFYIDNKLDNVSDLTDEEIIEKFKVYIKTKDAAWVERYDNLLIASFVGEPIGLKSTTDQENYEKLNKLLKPTIDAYLKENFR